LNSPSLERFQTKNRFWWIQSYLNIVKLNPNNQFKEVFVQVRFEKIENKMTRQSRRSGTNMSKTLVYFSGLVFFEENLKVSIKWLLPLTYQLNYILVFLEIVRKWISFSDIFLCFRFVSVDERRRPEGDWPAERVPESGGARSQELLRHARQ